MPVPGRISRRATPAAASASLADTKWPDLFQDDTLKQLIATALEQNLDLAIAAERVEEARAQFRITGANRYPFLYAEGEFAGNAAFAGRRQPDNTRPWIARLQLYASRRRALLGAGFVGPRAPSHRIGARPIPGHRGSPPRRRRLPHGRCRRHLFHPARARPGAGNRPLHARYRRPQPGIGSPCATSTAPPPACDVHQAEQLLYIASAQIASTQRDIGQTEDALSLLLGRPPCDIPRGKPMDDYGLPPELPAGLPSSLAGTPARYPRRRAEADRRQRADRRRQGLLLPPDLAYRLPGRPEPRPVGPVHRAGPRLVPGSRRRAFPIFNAGQVRVGVRLSEAQKREMIAAYQKAIYSAFREVSDALIGYQHTREQRRQQDQLVQALEETDRLSNLRYQGGMDSYLQVLDAERNLFQGRLALAQLRLQELLSFVQCYRALGGGWQ